jgi:hypothetical protein
MVKQRDESMIDSNYSQHATIRRSIGRAGNRFFFATNFLGGFSPGMPSGRDDHDAGAASSALCTAAFFLLKL